MERLNTTHFIANPVCWLFIAVLVTHVCRASVYDVPREPGHEIISSAAQVDVSMPLPVEHAVVEPEKKMPTVCIDKKELLYLPLIQQTSERHQVDPALVKAIIMAESGFNPNAVSEKGAKGLMQLMPKTAKALGVKDCFNPEHNIEGGVEYFKKLLNQFDGDVELALAAYNAGSRRVRQYQGVPPFKATRYYVKKVFEYYNCYKEHMKGEINRT
jgi:soluble lytic murein transglycosylase-like protein